MTEDWERQSAAFRAVWPLLTDEQRDRVRRKAVWEACSLIAVYRDWPSLFVVEKKP